jgi:hypothetical protein
MLSESQQAKVHKAIDQHERHKNSYFWSPATSASDRRWVESVNTWSVAFRHEGKRYRYDSHVSCSARNYYYSGGFFVNDNRRTIRVFRKLLKGS